MNRNLTKISVIVPVYNVVSYLSQCLESIIRQTLKDIEIILVDDGSTDGSGQICDEYALRDERIIVFHKQNEGLSSARNDGLDAATSDYIMFVDSDDWVESHFCEKAYMASIDYNADLVLFNYVKIYNNGTIVKNRPDIHPGLVTEFEALLFNLHYTPAVWLGLYRRELFDNVRFPIGKYHEDTGTSHRLLHEAKKIVYVDDALYNYRANRPGSIMTVKATREHHDLIEMRIIRIIDLWNWGYKELAQECAFPMLIQYGCRHDQRSLLYFVKEMKGHYPNDFSWKRKMLMKVFWCSTVLFNVICIITRKRIMNSSSNIPDTEYS